MKPLFAKIRRSHDGRAMIPLTEAIQILEFDCTADLVTVRSFARSSIEPKSWGGAMARQWSPALSYEAVTPRFAASILRQDFEFNLEYPEDSDTEIRVTLTESEPKS